MAFDQRSGRPDREPLSQINVTPLVDVMLVLLIIFMVTASMGQQGITVHLPRVKSAPLQVSDDMVVVSIDDKLNLFINSTAVNSTDLLTKLKDIYKDRPGRMVFIKSDRNVPYGEFVKVVSLVKSSGIEKLGMVTEQPQ